MRSSVGGDGRRAWWSKALRKGINLGERSNIVCGGIAGGANQRQVNVYSFPDWPWRHHVSYRRESGKLACPIGFFNWRYKRQPLARR